MSGEPDPPAAAAAKEEDRTDAKEDGVFEKFKAEMRGVAASMKKVLDEKQDCCVCLNGLVLGQQVHCYYPSEHIVHGSCSDEYMKRVPGGKPICPTFA